MSIAAALDAAMAAAEARFLAGDREPITFKTDRDYATDTDYAIEREVRTLLAEMTPEIGFLGEEEGHTGNRDEWWCLDPVDGTVNYSRRVPLCGISLGLVRDGIPVAGAISLPYLDERYRCLPGERGTLNGEPLVASKVTSWDEAIVSVGDFETGPGTDEHNVARLDVLRRLGAHALRVRMLGSAVADLSWLAAGRLDGVIFHVNHPWDTAAGVALALSAGCAVTTVAGGPWTVTADDMWVRAPGLPLDLP